MDITFLLHHISSFSLIRGKVT